MTRRRVSRQVPRPVLAAAALTGVEAAGLAVAGGLYLRAILAGRPSDRGTALFGAAMGLALAGLLALLARGLAQARRPALTPVVLTQLFLLPVSWGLYQGGQLLMAAVLAGLAVAILGCLFGTAHARSAFG